MSQQITSKADAIETVKLLQNLVELADLSKILNTFITAFEDKSIHKSDNHDYLHGNFNLGGTVSGRLSSSNPNLMNIPSRVSSSDPNLLNAPSTGTQYAKHIKQCFAAPSGWLFAGADYNSLEDMISALTTKDPNKLKVYIDGFDGHCLRAFSYFKDLLPDITDTVESINSIAKKYPIIRQDSKAPTFLLTYGGSYHGLMSNVGLSKEAALSIEANYHSLYIISDEWVQSKLEEASKVGYVTVAFGLRVRTPILHQTLLNKKSTPYEAAQEGRTAGNALGQSYGLLNSRTSVEFQKRVLASKYKYDIKPVASIHDANYFLIKNNLGCIKWFNDNLIECMQWQELPELKHDIVKLGGEVSIFYPTWKDEYVLPNKASKQEILEICK